MFDMEAPIRAMCTPFLQEKGLKINENFGIKNRLSIRKAGIDSVTGLLSPSRRETVVSVAGGRGTRTRRASPFSSAGTMCRRRGDCVIKVRQSDASERFTHDPFQRPDHVVVFRRDQCERVTGTLSASSAPDAMNVSIGGVRHIKVDNMGYAFHVETTGGDIGGNHDGKVPGLEAPERLFSLALRAVAVQAGHAESCVGDLAGELLRPMFGAGEDQHGIGRRLFQ